MDNKYLIKDDKEYEDSYNKHIESIKNEQSAFPIISNICSIEVVEAEFLNNEIFVNKFNELKNKYNKKCLRIVKKDGSCFYRGYLFRLITLAIYDSNFKNLLKNKIIESKNYLVSAGYELIIFEDYYDYFISTLNNTNSENALMTLFNNIENCNSLIFIIRLITSAYVKLNKFLFEFYFENEAELFKFCCTDIENIDAEVDQIQIIALNNYFSHINLKIYYIDNNKGPLSLFQHPEDKLDNNYLIELLYRPGHYDLLE